VCRRCASWKGFFDFGARLGGRGDESFLPQRYAIWLRYCWGRAVRPRLLLLVRMTYSSSMPFSLPFSRRSGRHYLTASGAADGCFLSGECSSFYVSIRSTFIALLRVFGHAALCFGCLDSEFRLKRASEFPFGVGLYLFLINSRKSCVIFELPANRFLRFLAPCFLGPVLCTVCESVLLKE